MITMMSTARTARTAMAPFTEARWQRLTALTTAGVLVLGACGDGANGDAGVSGPSVEVAAPPIVPAPTDTGSGTAEDAYAEQLDRLGAAVADWADATSIEGAHAAAETAANLVVGPNGPGFGDRDGNGSGEGATEMGLLPGLDGTPDGSASGIGSNECIDRDVLGGSWADPGDRWATMLAAIDAWTPDSNTMPSLQSHPMRVVGWATFTLASDDLDEAHEYAGHAQLHVDVARDALDC